MQFCAPHWIQLKTAADDRKLTTELIANAHNAITFNAVQLMGEHLVRSDVCPLCELKNNDGDVGDWIEGATNDQIINLDTPK